MGRRYAPYHPERCTLGQFAFSCQLFSDASVLSQNGPKPSCARTMDEKFISLLAFIQLQANRHASVGTPTAAPHRWWRSGTDPSKDNEMSGISADTHDHDHGHNHDHNHVHTTNHIAPQTPRASPPHTRQTMIHGTRRSGTRIGAG